MTGIMATIVQNAGLNLTSEIFTYMFILGWAGYAAMVYLVIKTLFDTLDLWKKMQNEKRGFD